MGDVAVRELGLVVGGRHTLETAAEGGLGCLRREQHDSGSRMLLGVAPELVVVGSGVWHYCVNSQACACWPAE